MRNWTTGLALVAMAMAPAMAGDLLVGNKSADTLWRLSLDDGTRRAEIATGPGPHEIAVAPDGGIAVVTSYGHGGPGNSLTVIALDDGSTRHVGLGDNARPHGLRFSVDGRRLLVTTEASNALVAVDAATGGVERVYDIGDGVGHMVALSADGGVAYVSKIRAGTIVRVDLATGKMLERPAGAGAEGIAVAPDGRVWVTNREADTVTVHDPASLDIVDTLASEGFPIRVAFTADGRHALVTNARAATLAVFDVARRRQVATVALAEEGREYRQTMLGRAALPIGVIADPERPRVYVAISGGNEVAVVDTGTWEVVDRWATGDEPDALALAPAQ